MITVVVQTKPVMILLVLLPGIARLKEVAQAMRPIVLYLAVVTLSAVVMVAAFLIALVVVRLPIFSAMDHYVRQSMVPVPTLVVTMTVV